MPLSVPIIPGPVPTLSPLQSLPLLPLKSLTLFPGAALTQDHEKPTHPAPSSGDQPHSEVPPPTPQG